MENASKALIIAGAILLAILIISLGILIFSQAQDTIDSVNMDEQEILAFNNKFLSYIGDNKSGSQVNALAQAVLANNQTAAENGETSTKGITMTLPNSSSITSDGKTTSFDRVPSGSTYDVDCTYNGALINTITVTAK